MANIINAITTGTGGLSTTADASGNIDFKSNGTTVASITSGGLAVTGALTVNGASPGRSGVTTTALTSGSPTLTLTSSSNQLQYVTATTTGCSIVMPNATTLTAGHDYFTIYNAGSKGISIKDNGGTIREYISPNTTLTVSIKDTSTSNGVWEFGNPPILNDGLSWIPMTLVSSYYYALIIPVTSTQCVLVYIDGSLTVLKCRLLTLNLSTRAITYGSEISITTVTGTDAYAEYLAGASDGVDRGFIQWCTRNQGTGATVGHYYMGFAIVSGTLYLSTMQTGSTLANTIFSMYVQAGACYLGSNNAFLSMAQRYVNSSSSGTVTLLLDLRMFTVTVAGTTVTVTNATGNGTISNTAATNTGTGPKNPPYVSRTSLTTFVYDKFNGASVYQSGGYINCDTSTNTITNGARTSQTTQMIGVTCSPCGGFGWYPFVLNSAGTKVMSGGYFYDVSNVGTATVTTAISSDITYKPFTATAYNTATASYGFLALAPIYSPGLINANQIGMGFSVSASEYIVISGTNYWSLDPSASTFNLNTGSLNMTVNPAVYNNYILPTILSSSQSMFISSTYTNSNGFNQYDILTLASPFKN